MIEKLRTLDDIPTNTQIEKNILTICSSYTNKINELVDTVNELQKQIDKVSCAILDLATPDGENKALKSIQAEPADPYAEQRRWIGKLCWVWDDDGDERAFTKLNEIIEDDDDRPFRGFARWKHCEPVKPDDNIIYKGE